jgi:hypothetical protein
VNADDLRLLTVPLRPLTQGEHDRIAEIASWSFEKTWRRIENTLSGKLLLDVLCRTDLSVEPSLLLFLSEKISTSEEATAWLYLLNFRRAGPSREVGWETFRDCLPRPDFWPEEAAVRACASAGPDLPGFEVWRSLVC